MLIYVRHLTLMSWHKCQM